MRRWGVRIRREEWGWGGGPEAAMSGERWVRATWRKEEWQLGEDGIVSLPEGLDEVRMWDPRQTVRKHTHSSAANSAPQTNL
eukprot:768622-Hanusia_phi.AAC.2